MGRLIYLPGALPPVPSVEESLSYRSALSRLVHGCGHGGGLYWPTMTPIALSSIAQLLGDERPVYHAESLGMVYDVRKAQALVARSKGRTQALLPVERQFLDATDADREYVRAMDPERVREPGILFTYYDADNGDAPMFQLLDGNHRYHKAGTMGLGEYLVYPLTPGEARLCEWFFAIKPGQALRRPRYRWFEEE